MAGAVLRPQDVRVPMTHEVTQAHYVFGGLKVCAGLPLSAADQIDRGHPWDVVEGSRAAFGSWGGHSMFSNGYDRVDLWVWTWGGVLVAVYEEAN
jgi:hypothetical protein